VQKKALIRIQNKVRRGEVVITPHAAKGMADDGFYKEDVLQGIFSGNIIDRQHDFSTGEKKYLIHGNSTQPNRGIGIVVKELSGVILITVFEVL
jgi:hypothetical protein